MDRGSPAAASPPRWPSSFPGGNILGKSSNALLYGMTVGVLKLHIVAGIGPKPAPPFSNPAPPLPSPKTPQIRPPQNKSLTNLPLKFSQPFQSPGSLRPASPIFACYTGIRRNQCEIPSRPSLPSPSGAFPSPPPTARPSFASMPPRPGGFYILSVRSRPCRGWFFYEFLAPYRVLPASRALHAIFNHVEAEANHNHPDHRLARFVSRRPP
jgi:hypothetical protein